MFRLNAGKESEARTESQAPRDVLSIRTVEKPEDVLVKITRVGRQRAEVHVTALPGDMVVEEVETGRLVVVNRNDVAEAVRARVGRG